MRQLQSSLGIKGWDLGRHRQKRQLSPRLDDFISDDFIHFGKALTHGKGRETDQLVFIHGIHSWFSVWGLGYLTAFAMQQISCYPLIVPEHMKRCRLGSFQSPNLVIDW